MSRSARLVSLLALLAPVAAAPAPAHASPLLDNPVSLLTLAGAPQSVVATDVNRDGRPDLITADASGSTGSAFITNASGAPQAPLSVNLGGSTPRGLATGSADADGDVDLFVASGSEAGFRVILNNGASAYAAPSASQPLGADPRDLALADLNHDGISDVVAALGGGQIAIRLSTGPGTWAAATLSGVNPPVTTPTDVLLADLNGDGASAVVLSGNGDVRSLVLDDFDLDGAPDVAGAAAIGNRAGIALSRGRVIFGPVDFGSVVVGESSSEVPLPFRNTGGAPVTITSSGLTGHSADFAVRTGGCQGRLFPGESCTFTASFAPTAAGPRAATLGLPMAGNLITPRTAELTGEGVAAQSGPTGPAGPAGPTGLTGPTGPGGPAGPEGPSGPTGPAGDDGSDGAQGPVGADGPQAPAGAAGASGAPGSPGPSGLKGETGPPGRDALVTCKAGRPSKPRKGRVRVTVTCRVALAAGAARSARLVREGRTMARAVSARRGSLRLRGGRMQGGLYTLISGRSRMLVLVR
jgi:hypothetical protein